MTRWKQDLLIVGAAVVADTAVTARPLDALTPWTWGAHLELRSRWLPTPARRRWTR